MQRKKASADTIGVGGILRRFHASHALSVLLSLKFSFRCAHPSSRCVQIVYLSTILKETIWKVLKPQFNLEILLFSKEKSDIICWQKANEYDEFELTDGMRDAML